MCILHIKISILRAKFLNSHLGDVLNFFNIHIQRLFLIAATFKSQIQMSVDGLIAGPNGEID
jgi:hypothetical protein